MSKFNRYLAVLASRPLTHVPCLGCGAMIPIDDAARRVHFTVCGLPSLGDRVLDTGLRAMPVLVMFEKEV